MLISNGAIGKVLAETLGDNNVGARMRGHGDVISKLRRYRGVFRAPSTQR